MTRNHAAPALGQVSARARRAEDRDRDQPECDEAGGVFAALVEDVLGQRGVIALPREDDDRCEVDKNPGAAEQRQDDEAQPEDGGCDIEVLAKPSATPARILSLRLRSRRLTIGVWSVCSLMPRGCLGRDAGAIRNHPVRPSTLLSSGMAEKTIAETAGRGTTTSSSNASRPGSC